MKKKQFVEYLKGASKSRCPFCNSSLEKKNRPNQTNFCRKEYHYIISNKVEGYLITFENSDDNIIQICVDNNIFRGSCLITYERVSPANNSIISFEVISESEEFFPLTEIDRVRNLVTFL